MHVKPDVIEALPYLSDATKLEKPIETLRSAIQESQRVLYLGPQDHHFFQQFMEGLNVPTTIYAQQAPETWTPPKPLQFSILKDQISDFRFDRAFFQTIICRFQFASQPHSRELFDEVCEWLQPGGLLFAEEYDNAYLTHYPIPSHLSLQIRELADILHRQKIFDPWLGRKLHSFVAENEFDQIQLRVACDHLFHAEASIKESQWWTQHLKKIQQLLRNQNASLSFDLLTFQRELFSFFNNPHRFSYSPSIQIVGIKA